MAEDAYGIKYLFEKLYKIKYSITREPGPRSIEFYSMDLDRAVG